MAVYIDNMRAGFGRMIICHMIADSTQELNTMADAIGVRRQWIQYPETAREHYDICLSVRRKAIRLGAVEITMKELVRKMRAKCLLNKLRN